MSGGETVATAAAQRAASGAGRLARAWRKLPHERRLAACASLGLLISLFLPWYQQTVIVRGKTAELTAASASITGWGAFSFVEAAMLLVAGGVLLLLFQRAEGRAFHLPGGDGGVITGAGAWACVLVIWRVFDKQGTSSHGELSTTTGVEWGIFVALGVAVLLTYAGTRVRAAHRPEPPLPGEHPRASGARLSRASRAAEPVPEEPTLPFDREEPTLPFDREEPTLPFDREEPTLPFDREEPTLPSLPRRRRR